MKNHEGPVLDCCWSEDNSKVFSVGADKKGMLWDLGSDQFKQVPVLNIWSFPENLSEFGSGKT